MSEPRMYHPCGTFSRRTEQQTLLLEMALITFLFPAGHHLQLRQQSSPSPWPESSRGRQPFSGHHRQELWQQSSPSPCPVVPAVASLRIITQFGQPEWIVSTVFTMSVVYYGPSLCNPPWCNPPGTRENTLYVNSSRRTSLCVECARALWASLCFSVSSANQQSSAFRSHHLQQLRQQLSPSPWLMSASSRQPIEGHQLLQQRQESSPSLRPVSSNSPHHFAGTV